MKNEGDAGNSESKNDAIKLPGKHLYLGGLALVVVLLVAGYYFYYAPKQTEYAAEQARNASLAEYKRLVYESLLCQSSCPLTEQRINNQTQLMPSRECWNACTNQLASKGYNKTSFSADEILGDSLFADLDKALRDCQNEATANSTSMVLNSTLYFGCSKEKIAALRENYGYLR